MKTLSEGRIKRSLNEIDNLSQKELTLTICNSLYSYKELETRIIEFNSNFAHTNFYECVQLHFGKSMIKHCSPHERINWEVRLINNQIFDFNKTSVEIMSIMNDFINAESKKKMQRILVIRDVTTPDGNVLKDRTVYDYSLLNSHEQSEKQRSILFNEENQSLIKHYYSQYLYYFPVTLTEFEEIFFFFLTFLIERQYPTCRDVQDVYSFIKEINELVRMRYIDINDRMIMAFINIIESDYELRRNCKSVSKEIEDINSIILSQAFEQGT